MYNLFSYPQEFGISRRKLESYVDLANIKAYYNRNPVRFMEEVLGAKLLDAQAAVVERSWNTPYVLWVCSRGFGKSTLVDLFIMAKGMLNDNYISYIASGTGEQSIQTFTTLEKLAEGAIESMPGLTGVFMSEISVNNSSGNGFIHNPSGHYYSLYNNSMTKTLNGNIDRRRGARADLVVFDETGWLSEELMSVYSAFTIVNKEMKLGGNIDYETLPSLPRAVPHQLFFVSSASSVDTPFFKRYREYSKNMILGDSNYFVADINCDVVIKATVGGKLYPASLLKQETVDSEMKQNPEKALREYYNIFTQDGGIGQIIKRAEIVKNSFVRPPILLNDTNARKIVMAYDPARSTDNSVLGIAELREDPKKGYMLDIINMINFADLGLQRKTPMMTQDQIREIRKTILRYNGEALDYDNIEIFMADAGSGGGGNSWVRDSLIESWKDVNGNEHPGLIDKEYAPEYIRRYPNAVDKLKLLEPTRYKSEMFEAMIKMIEAGLITFPERYDNKGYLTLLEVDEKTLKATRKRLEDKYKKMDLSIDEFEEKVQEELDKLNVTKVKTYTLSPDEEMALGQIDACKEEVVNMVRVKRDSGKDTFRLAANKAAETGGLLHDDRAYVLSMLSWYLSEKRVEKIRKKKKNVQTRNLAQMLPFKAPKGIKRW